MRLLRAAVRLGPYSGVSVVDLRGLNGCIIDVRCVNNPDTRPLIMGRRGEVKKVQASIETTSGGLRLTLTNAGGKGVRIGRTGDAVASGPGSVASTAIEGALPGRGYVRRTGDAIASAGGVASTGVSWSGPPQEFVIQPGHPYRRDVPRARCIVALTVQGGTRIWF